jgi:hypothetical protein
MPGRARIRIRHKELGVVVPEREILAIAPTEPANKGGAALLRFSLKQMLYVGETYTLEVLETDELVGANGFVELGTFLAVLGGTIATLMTATIAGAIGMLANFAMFFGGRDENGQPTNPIAGLAMMIIAPLAASLVQMAISRSREYEADRVGAEIAGDPTALARALEKIEMYAQGRLNLDAERNPATAHMFIINPLSGHGADNLFSTHPATRNRIAKLAELAGAMRRTPRGGTSVPVTDASPWS